MLSPLCQGAKMKSLKNLANYPFSLPLIADEILEFHAARLILLLHICGTNDMVNGLTKMAKLDFFIRYPEFFAFASQVLENKVVPSKEHVESYMVRYHYGPWDQRYYHVLAYLEARQLIQVMKDNKTYNLTLTKDGNKIAKELENDDNYLDLVMQMHMVSKLLGNKNGAYLKNLIYKLFDKRVGSLSLGEPIK